MVPHFSTKQEKAEFHNVNVKMQGDVKVTFYDHSVKLKSQKLFYLCFNTAMVQYENSKEAASHEHQELLKKAEDARRTAYLNGSDIATKLLVLQLKKEEIDGPPVKGKKSKKYSKDFKVELLFEETLDESISRGRSNSKSLKLDKIGN